MLTGEYRHSIDPKKRLFIPAKHREELGSSFMIVRDLRSPRLKVYSMAEWEKYVARIEQLPSRRLVEDALRFFHRVAVQAEPDSQGRVILTQALLDYAHITKDVVIVGCSNCAEIWAADAHDELVRGENPAEMTAEMETMGF